MTFFKKAWGMVFYLLCALGFTGCGIEDYPYLVPPVKSVLGSDTLQRIITFPKESDQTFYFKEYLIFYKLYTTDDLNSTNPAISIDNAAIASANDNTPTELATILRNKGFFEIAFGADSEETITDIINNPLSLIFDDDINGQTIKIDFNLSIRPYPVLVKDDDSTYRLLRTEESVYPDPSYQNLANHASLSLEELYNQDVNHSASGSQYAHVALFILAAGIDAQARRIFSTALDVGVFPLGSGS